MKTRLYLIVALASVTAFQPGSPARAADEPAFTPLFNGRDLEGLYTFLQKHGKGRDPDRVVTIEDGAIHLYKHAAEGSEVVMGYISTKREYGDFHLRFEYRWGDKKFKPRYALKRDAGLYYHIIGPDAIWPTAVQYQIEQTNVGDLVLLYGYTVDTWIDPKTKKAAQSTFLPADKGGEAKVQGGKGIFYQKHLAGDHELEGWNKAEIIVKDGSITHILNGRVLNQGKNLRYADPKRDGAIRRVDRGRIAIEIEAAEIYFRVVEIKDLSASSTGERRK